MKTYFTLFCCLLISLSTAVAQDLKPFKVGIGVGYAAPGNTGAGAGGGALFFIEPAYRASDNVSIGLRLESAIIARGIKGVGDNDVSGDASSNVSYTLNTQYYFNDNYVRPFIGAGLGLFSLASVKFNTQSPIILSMQMTSKLRPDLDSIHGSVSMRDTLILPSTTTSFRKRIFPA